MRVIDSLLEKGVDIEAVDVQGRTPLLYAVQKYKLRLLGEVYWFNDNGRDEIQLLLDKGANINTADNEGRTPFSDVLVKDWNESKGIFDPVIAKEISERKSMLFSTGI